MSLLRARTLTALLLITASILALPGCGGGDGGGGGGTTGGITFTSDKSSISFNFNQNQSPPPQTITITSTGQYTGALYIAATVSGPGLASTIPATISGTTGTAQISAASGLAPGSYSGQLSLAICSDAACAHQLGNSPVVIAYSVTVTVPPPPTVGGTVSGLSAGQSVTLLNNSGDALSVVSDGGFVFSKPLAVDGTYAVTVQSHTAGISCAISNGSGTAGVSNVTNVTVSCAPGTETTLYAFVGGITDGANPQAGLIMDSTGNMYGTTFYGGAHNGNGTVFKITPAGAETVLYAFAGGATDGAEPQSSLLMDTAGNLYGSTYFGGANNYGTVFKISPTGTETVLHFFAGGMTDGVNAQGGLAMDGAGNLYGMTHYGGASGIGTVYKIASDGTESLLYSFDAINGANPQASLIIDNAGNLYGTTVNNGGNGSGSGAVFKVTPAGAITDLYSFIGTFPGTPNNGTSPEAGLIMDSAGNLYGTTDLGGANNLGTVFKISATGTETVLHSFAGGTADGSHPQASLIMDSAGNLFGTTYDGGAKNVGTVFMISATGTETVLHSFAGDKTDGGNPQGALVMDSAGNLYGTTYTYGTNGLGTVFKID